jgi:hypothetical protein
MFLTRALRLQVNIYYMYIYLYTMTTLTLFFVNAVPPWNPQFSGASLRVSRLSSFPQCKNCRGKLLNGFKGPAIEEWKGARAHLYLLA